MSTHIFVRLLLASLVAALGFGVAAWGRFTLSLGDGLSLGHDALGLLIFLGGVVFGYRTVKAHFDAEDARQA